MDFALMHDKLYRRHLADVPYASVATLQFPILNQSMIANAVNSLKLLPRLFFTFLFPRLTWTFWIMHDAKQR